MHVHRAFFASFAILFASTAFSASVTMPTPSPTEISYLDSELTPFFSANACDSSGNVGTCLWGMMVPENAVVEGNRSFSLTFRSSGELGFVWWGGIQAWMAPPPTDVQLRFSSPSLRTFVSAVDLDTNLSLSVKPAAGITFEINMANSKNVEVTFGVEFEPGHFLTTSKDPSCMSISCLTPGQDKATLGTLGFMTSPIPEPSPALLLLLGLTAGAACRAKSGKR